MAKRTRYTVVAGCGRLGATLAGKLSEEKQDVLVLDCNKAAFRKLPKTYGGLTLTGGVTDIEKLKEAQLDQADTFLVVTNQDSINICAAQMAKVLFKVPKVVVRIYDEDKLRLVQDMDIETICPVVLSQEEIGKCLSQGGEAYVAKEIQ